MPLRKKIKLRIKKRKKNAQKEIERIFLRNNPEFLLIWENLLKKNRKLGKVILAQK